MDRKPSESFDPGVGATEELRLRVSVATLTRVLFAHPANGELMLALERKATLREWENGGAVHVKSQPFGGAVRIQDLRGLQDSIGEFHFDSGRSRSEQDFRIYIRPSDWPAVREFCIEQFHAADGRVLEADPTRELTEEFFDALKLQLRADQYPYQPLAIVVEEDPAPTANIHAKGHRTARVYRIFEARIVDPSLVQGMMQSASLTDQGLREIAMEERQRGGRGRANAILALPWKDVIKAYQALSPDARTAPILFADHLLDETVAAVLEGIKVPKYRRI